MNNLSEIKEHYGHVTLHPQDFPIKSFEEQNAACNGMYDCIPLDTIEKFEGEYLYSFSESFKNILFIGLLILALMFVYRFLKKK